MSVTLEDAIRALDARKDALRGDSDPHLTAFEMRGLLVGLDLDALELSEGSQLVMETFLTALLTGATDVDAAFRGCWSDGVMTGLLLAHLREREEARS
ncbi:MAG TPA: hypothetical protein VFH80_17495 [Solirubrobacteraceae bacterium]|nr:hypothetical protein [Solirubrobacteraceae bacterium]